MRAVQIRFDEDLLRRELAIDAQYERAYTGVSNPLGEEFEGWEGEGVIPETEGSARPAASPGG